MQDMPKHIQGRATPKPAKIARPARVSLRRRPTVSPGLRDAPASHGTWFLVDPRAGDETELTLKSRKGL